LKLFAEPINITFHKDESYILNVASQTVLPSAIIRNN